MKFRDINEATDWQQPRSEIKKNLDKAFDHMRQAEHAMNAAASVTGYVWTGTVPMKKAARKVELARKAVMDIKL